MVSFKSKQRFVIFAQYQIAEMEDVDGLPINDQGSLSVSGSPNHTVISLPDYSQPTASFASFTNSESPNPPPDFLDTGVDDSDIIYLPNQADWREVSETPPSGDAENLPPVLSQDPPLEEPLESPAAFVELKDVTYKNIIQQLGSQLTDTKQTPLYISRSRVFRSAGTGLTNSSFNPKGDIFVKFMDEWGLDERGVDTGGLRNEFFRLALKEVSMSPMFEGEHMSRNLALHADSLRLNDYKTAGIIMALAIVHNGPVPQFFSPELFEMLVSGEYSREVAISKVMDADIRTEIETLSAAKDLRELENAVVNSMLLTIQGVTSEDSFRRKQAIIDNVLDYCLNIRLQPAFNQLCEGLKTLHVLEFVRKYPTKMRTAFVKPEAKLTAAVVKKMLQFKFSDDERQRIKEESMLCHLLYYLDNLEDGKLVNVTLEDFLILLTAYPNVPPGGFQKKLTIELDHSTAEGLRPYPWASYCDLRLTLPIYTCQYADFEERMSEALQTKNFGRV
ncbi:G2/M phase-specific E3 ubiquitin-protein ligase [Bemisia tabaci]|uniref:G2/M phase-specific E3 ubiquitin-protein ligase n=1 Tax=Bemisia tabaci TaxID=7038 RepID=UPI003B2804DC